jgi:hypothetical protein
VISTREVPLKLLKSRPRGAAMENPSADRFGPPPEQRQREREELKTAARVGGAVGTTSMVVALGALELLSHTTRGWIAAGACAMSLVGFGVQFALSHRRQEDDPYSPPAHLTR